MKLHQLGDLLGRAPWWATLGAPLALWWVLFIPGWSGGWLRGLLLLGLAATLALLTLTPRPVPRSRALTLFLTLALLLGIGHALVRTVEHARHIAATGDVVLDIGQSAYRAGVLLSRGNDPYAEGTLLDPLSYTRRSRERAAVGLAPTMPEGEVAAALARYWQTLDPTLGQALLPAPQTPEARREAAILGYKYGPTTLLIFTACAAVGLGPWSVLAVNGVAVVTLLIALALALRRAGCSRDGVLAGLAFVLADPYFAPNYLGASATDVHALALGMLALSSRRGGVVVGVLVGLAVGAKLLPGLVFAPLILTRPRALAFGVVVLALHLPFLVWEPYGFVHNLVLWSTLRPITPGSWMHYVPPVVAVVGRVLIVASWLWAGWRARHATHEQARRLAIVALLALLVGPVLHGNYLSWPMALIALALVPRYFSTEGLLHGGYSALPARGELASP